MCTWAEKILGHLKRHCSERDRHRCLSFFALCGCGFVSSIRFNVASRTLAVSAGVRSSCSFFVGFGMRIGLDHIKEMHRSVGHALAHWQYVETGLYLGTHCLLDTKHELSSTVFFHIESARSKISLTDKLCRRCLKQATYQRHWMPLKKEINEAVEIRNALAHFDLSGIDPAKTKRKNGEPSALPLILTPNSHDESAVRPDGGVKALYVEDLHETSAWYRKLAQSLLAFPPKHIPDWQPRTASLPPATRRLMAAIQSETTP